MQLDRKKVIGAMVDACLNPKEVAEKAGLSAGTISRIIGGNQVDTSTGTLGKLAKALGIPWQSLLVDESDFQNLSRRSVK